MATYKATSPAVPLGLQKLAYIDFVTVSQKMTTFANKYVVKDQAGEVLFNVKEDSSALDVVLGGTKRPFYIDLYDANNHLVISLRRPYSLGASKLKVTVGGELACVVRQEPTFMKPVLSINDAQDKPVLRVKGPAMYEGECTFDLLTLDKRPIGSIHKKWNGLMRELFTDSDHFNIRFPKDLDVRYKAAVIGTCLLIDFLYYEKS